MKISVPPTLLISSIGVIEDVRLCQTMDFKFAGDLLYVLGITGADLGGSEYARAVMEKNPGEKYGPGTVPGVDPGKNIALYRRFEEALRQGLVSSSTSVERGGLAVALVKSALAGCLGFDVDLAGLQVEGTPGGDALLFAESPGRLLVSVDPASRARFEALMKGIPCAAIGAVSPGGALVFRARGKVIAAGDIETCGRAYRETLRNF